MASIRERAKGSYEITVYDGYNINGKKLRYTKTITIDPFKFRDFFTFSRKTLIVSRFLVYFYIKNLFFIFQPSLNKPIMNRLFTLCNYFLEQRKLAIVWRRFLYILPFFYSNLGIF